MVSSNGRRSSSSLKTIRKVLKSAHVPSFRYSISKLIENRVNIVHEEDGIHVFILERGKREGEKVFDSWYDAIVDIANYYPLNFTSRIIQIADEEKEKQRESRSVIDRFLPCMEKHKNKFIQQNGTQSSYTTPVFRRTLISLTALALIVGSITVYTLTTRNIQPLPVSPTPVVSRAPIATNTVIPTQPPKPTSLPTDQSDKFIQWWEKKLNGEYVICKLPFNQSVEVYPSFELLDDERLNDPLYAKEYINYYTDDIRIQKIVQDPQTNAISALIRYRSAVNHEIMSGYVRIKHLIDVSAAHLAVSSTQQTTRVYLQPDLNDEQTDIQCIGVDETIYLLAKRDGWQQVLYNYKYQGWYLFWIREEELSLGWSCIINPDVAQVKKSPNDISESVMTVYSGEEYTIQDEATSPLDGVLWYKVNAKGKTGWICSDIVTINLKEY